MRKFTHAGLFEGIGGFSIASRAMGWDTKFWCEINPFCQTVLKYHFPNATGHEDITKTDFTQYANQIDILTGGFPCQPFSVAGKQLGTADTRHLWPSMLRAIQEIKPRYVVGENVGGILSWDEGVVFEQVHLDLEAEGYEVWAWVLPACAVDAPHRRDRVWFIARNTKHNGPLTTEIGGTESKPQEQEEPQQKRQLAGTNSLQSSLATNSSITRFWSCIQGILSNTQSADETGLFTNSSNAGIESMRSKRKNSVHRFGTTANANSRRQSRKKYWEAKSRWSTKKGVLGNWQNFPTQPPICGGNDGLSSQLAGITVSKHRNESIKAYGNAIVPQVAFQIFKAIQQIDALE